MVWFRALVMVLLSGEVFAANGTKPKHGKNSLAKKRLDSDSTPPRAEEIANLRMAIAGGLQNIYLPSLSMEALASRGDFQIGGELGFFQFSQSQFHGSTNFIGVSGRWRINSSQPYFLGVSLGSRSVSLTTNADLSYSDTTSGATSVTTIAWTRKVSQTVLYPKAGFMWSTDKAAIIAGAGLLMPLASKASISGNPPSATGISDADYQATSEQKLRDVTKTTNAVLPGLEFKYLRYIN